jgi:hypothetical protein
VITYSYYYSNTQQITPVNESATNSITVSALALSYTLTTSYYDMFLFINDILNTNLAAFINNGSLIASCNGGTMI